MGDLFWVLSFVNLLWIIAVTVLVFRQRTWMGKLFPDKDGDFKTRLGEVLKEVESLEQFKQKFAGTLQRVAVKRYNPYRDTGGDQSFSVALLDGRGDGVVITSLHSRAGTRVFAKSIKSGQEDKFPLSSEEQEVVAQALI